MKARELRIGSIVYNNRVVAEISASYFTDTNGMSTLFRDAKPITLTEEWLLKLGLKENGNYYYLDSGRQSIIVSIAQDNDFVFLYREDVGLPYKLLRFIEYVHEVQNLFFALTGEELKINLNVK